MAIGSVSVNQINNNQGEFKQVEKTFLYVIAGATAAPIAVNNATDLSAAPFNNHPVLTAARDNAKDENFFAYVMPVTLDVGDDMANELELVKAAFEVPNNLEVECVVLAHRSAVGTDVAKITAFANSVNTTYGLNINVIVTANIDNDDNTWAVATAALIAEFDAKVEKRISVVPNFGNAEDMTYLGIACGRLCAANATIADTPMRVATGAIVGDWPAFVDSAGAPFTMALAKQLADARISICQTYPGYPGVYWADHPTLDTETGDYKVIEYQRVMDYLARRVRLLAIGRVGDRRLNSTAPSIESNKTYLMRPLREAAQTTIINGEEQPGLIEKLSGNDGIEITWTSKTAVSVAITAKPYGCPKSITLNLALDLSV